MRIVTECSNRECGEYGSSTGNITIEQWQVFFTGKNTGPLRKADRREVHDLTCTYCGYPIGITLEGEGFISRDEEAAMLAMAIKDNAIEDAWRAEQKAR